MKRISRFSTLTARMHEGLKKFPTDFDHVLGVRANTLYALERRGFVEHAPNNEDSWKLVAEGVLDAADTFAASRRMWRRTDKGSIELSRIIDGK